MQPLAPAGAGMAEAAMVGEDARSTSTSISESHHHDAPPHMLHRSSSTRLSLRAANIRHRLRAMGSTAGSQAATVPSVGLDRSVAGGSGVGLSVSVTAESGPTPLATAPHTAEDRKTLSKRLDSLSETVANPQPPPPPPSLNAASEAVAAAPGPSVASRPPLLKAASRAPSTNLDASTPFFDLVGNVMVGADVTGPSGAKPWLLPLEEAAGEGSTSVTQLLCRDLPRKYFANYPMQCANLALIVLSFVLYVIETYIPLQTGFNLTGTIGAYTAFMLLLEYGLSVMFTFDFLCTLVLAPSATAYLLSYWGVVEVFSILPGYLTLAGITYMSFFRILRLMKVVRIMRLHHLRGTAGPGSSSDEQEDATDVELASIVRTISLAILLMTGIVYAAATASPTPLYSKAVLQFHDALYYVVVTIATVGYGDIFPTEPFSRMLAVVIIVLAFTIIPYAIGQLIDTLRRRESEKYYRTVRLKTGQPHVVICGHLTHKGLHRFVQELFHPNYRHLHPDMAAVVLSPDPPRGRMRSLLTHSRYSARMHYVAGSPHFSLDLQRARVSTARAVFILSQVVVNESNSPQEDRLLLYDMAIRQHIHHQRAKDSLLAPSSPAQSLLQSRPPQVLLQVNTTAAKEKVMMENDKALTPPRPRPPASSGSAASHSPGWSTNSSPKNRSDTPTQDEDAVINPVSLVSQAPSQRCISTLEFKMAVMAYGLVFRGFIGLFLNTLRSTPSSNRSMTSAQSWLHGYRAGATYNVYSVRLNTERHETVVGKTFLEVATSLYAASRLVAVAVKDDRHVRLNPGPDFTFRAKTVCVIFVLAQSYAQIESALEQLDTTCMEQQQHPAPAASSSPTTLQHSHHPHHQRQHRQWFGSGRRDYGVYSKLALGVPTTSACPRSAPLPTSHPTPVVSSGIPSSTGSVKRQSASAEEVRGLLTEASRCADQIKTQPYEDRIKLLGLADKGRQCLEKIIEAQALLQHDSDALKGLSGHIVVCLCSSAASPPASYAWLEHLLVPLRRLINSPVVVLGHNRAAFLDLLHGLHAVSATERDASTGASRLEVGDIFFHQGSAHSRADLQAVKVTEAIRVVLLSSSGSGADSSGGSSSQVPEDAEGFALGDRDVLLAMSTLEVLLPNDLYDKVYTVTDIIHDGNSKHLRQEGSNSLAAAASQTNMQHQLTWDQTLNLMRGGGAPGVSALLQQSEHALLLQPAGGAVREDLYDWPLIASGRVCPQGGLDVLLVRMFYNPLEMEFWKNLLNIHHARKSLVSSRLHPSCLQGYLDQVSVPSDLRGRRYEEAVQDLMADGVVVLGLYRPMGCLGAPMAYVHVAPPPSTVLDPSDKLFVVMPPRLADENDTAPGAAEAALSRLVFKTPPRPGKADDKDATGPTLMPSLPKPSPAKASGGAGRPTELAMTTPPRPLPSLSATVGNKQGERGIQQPANEKKQPLVTVECKDAKTGAEARAEAIPDRDQAREQKADGSHGLTTAGTDMHSSVAAAPEPLQNAVAAAGVEEKGFLSHSDSSVAPEAGSLEDSSAPSSAASTVTTTTNSSEGSQA